MLNEAVKFSRVQRIENFTINKMINLIGPWFTNGSAHVQEFMPFIKFHLTKTNFADVKFTDTMF